MGRKNVVLHKVTEAQSLAANFTSAATIIRYLDNCAYQINVTGGGSSGTFSVEGSLDYAVSEANDDAPVRAGNWVALNLTGTPTITGSNDTILIDLNQLPFNAIRLKYTSTVAGAGSCDVYVMSRQLGG